MEVLKLVLFFLLVVYACGLVGFQISLCKTRFIRPKGLWNLVVLRVDGFRSVIYPEIIYNMKWINSPLNFEDCRIDTTLTQSVT